MQTGTHELENDPRSTPGAKHFTLDGSESLERHLTQACQAVLEGVRRIVPVRQLQAVVLGGGYGRGEGGVLRTEAGDRPYNDLEFYILLRGSRLWNDRKFRHVLEGLADGLSPEAGLHVEFKIDSLRRLRHSPVSMFSYDLIAGHRLVHGPSTLFQDCAHHLDASRIPLSEAIRLLFNRCTGLLLVQEMLSTPAVSRLDRDFVTRNIAKAKLALGDAVLTAGGQYHWSCRERHTRLKRLTLTERQPWLEQVRQHHAAGVEFKLHPSVSQHSTAEFKEAHRELSALALGVWLWLENHRLKTRFASIGDYALNPQRKWPDSNRARNWLLNLRTFGASSLFAGGCCRYPRERLLNTLPLLLFGTDLPDQVIDHTQRQLQTAARDWAALVHAYKRLWLSYG
jgi:hypothetical protein